MRLLIDTNVFLEVILWQEKAEEAWAFLRGVEEHDLFISDYSFHSIGLLLFRRKLHDVFRQFVTDMMLNAGVVITSLLAEDMAAVVNTAQRFGLDFDDAYQYVVAQKHNLIIVSFDSDFDRTEQGRNTPGEVIES